MGRRLGMLQNDEKYQIKWYNHTIWWTAQKITEK
jgi:hypothetical protein